MAAIIVNMPPILAKLQEAALIVVDLQPTFLAPIARGESVLKRADFLIRAASLLEVPILATEQYPSRMGSTHQDLMPLLQEANATIAGKMKFSCIGCSSFEDWVEEHNRKQVVMVGIETHICVNQTAHHLLQEGREVLIAADAVGARNDEMHKVGLKRMRQAGAVIAHSESIVYEWLDTAEHPKFRDVLKLVKESSA